MKPIGDVLIVRQHKDEDYNKWSVIVPNLSEKNRLSGEVVYAGDKAQSKPGDTVVFNQWAFSKLDKDGDKLLIMKETNVGIILKQIQND
jgi:co-chaperonin GroES (HSP10)